MRLSALLLTGGLILGTPGTAFADHDRDCDWNGNCGYYGDGGSRQDYDQWNNEDHNRNRGRDRGAFSPGPFTDSPITIIVCPPGTQQCGNGQPDKEGGGSENP